MSIIQKFSFQESQITVIKDGDEIWFKGKDVADILGYKDTDKSIRNHVDVEDKKKMSELGFKFKPSELVGLEKSPSSKVNEMGGLERNEKNTVYINESG